MTHAYDAAHVATGLRGEVNGRTVLHVIIGRSGGLTAGVHVSVIGAAHGKPAAVHNAGNAAHVRAVSALVRVAGTRGFNGVAVCRSAVRATGDAFVGIAHNTANTEGALDAAGIGKRRKIGKAIADNAADVITAGLHRSTVVTRKRQ